MTTITPYLGTADLDRLRAFYQGLFDATETDRVATPDGTGLFYLGLAIGDSAIALVSEEGAGTGQDRQRIGLNVMVPSVDELLDRVVELGGAVLSPPNDMPWGHRVAHVLDPDGNAVNLTQQL